jgi:hypothetical protein
MDGVDLAQGRDRWRSVVNVIMKVQASKMLIFS